MTLNINRDVYSLLPLDKLDDIWASESWLAFLGFARYIWFGMTALVILHKEGNLSFPCELNIVFLYPAYGKVVLDISCTSIVLHSIASLFHYKGPCSRFRKIQTEQTPVAFLLYRISCRLVYWIATSSVLLEEGKLNTSVPGH